ncbi:MAG: A/G-specific adenine glycosylase [Firmicutes bacterium HGW-Firmicutes-7]|nr:MAG: A/G-specific adenine glycosylase [Firmicutes bacterium HGW-Firmicutes-7]
MELEITKIFQDKLLEWYDNHARILPWRDNPSPYRVWISEIMLQQTRVDTVKPYFEKFMKEVPTIKELAIITEDKLLKLWEGLGYYTRARNLKKAANMVLSNYDGEIPSNVEALQSLPGIGPYSSGAIASIAFGIKIPAIDGNVLRVIARVMANKGDITNQIVKKEIAEFVNRVLPVQRVGDFNQALMELGATICLPTGIPKCSICPIQEICQGYKLGIATELPLKAKKKTRKVQKKTVFVLHSNNRTAIRQRSEVGLLSNLWEFPHIEGHLSIEECEEVIRKWNISAQTITPMSNCKHIFTHLEWHLMGYFVLIDNIEESDFVWVTNDEIKKKYSIPTAFKAYVKYLFERK